MTTQYTPILQLALPIIGELNGTWGDVVNNNITSMVEQAIAGMATINTWTANAHTLTTANGTTDEARCAMLVLQTGSGGTALSAAGQVICPDDSKLYVVQNNAAYAVTVKTAAGTGIAVAAGDSAFVFCDGTNVNACVTQIINGHITGNLTVDGNTTLGDSSADTVVINAGSTTLNDGGAIRFEDNAGGEYVALKAPATIAASFTLTLPIDDGASGQALITDGSGNLSWSTAASGDVYGPASATNTAVALFDGTTGKLLKNSVVTIDGSGNVSGLGTVNATTLDLTNLEVNNIKAKDGTASITLADSTGVASFTAAPVLNSGTANQIQYLNGSKQLVGDADLTFDGTTLSATNITSSGTVTLSGGTANGVAYLNGSKVLTTGSALTFDGSNLGLGVTPSAWDTFKVLQIGVGGSLATINAIETELGQGYYYASGWKYSVSGSSVARYSQYLGTHTWFTAPSGTAGNAISFTQAMTLGANGSLGIGATSPAYVLNTNYTAPSSFTNASGDFTQMWQAGGTNALGVALSTGDTTARFVANNGYKFAWNLASTQAMTLDASGNLGVGTSSPTAKCHVFQNAASVPAISRVQTGSSGNSFDYAAFAVNAPGATGGLVAWATGSIRGPSMYLGSNESIPLIFGTADTERMRINSSGNLLVGTTTTSSVVTSGISTNILGTTITQTYTMVGTPWTSPLTYNTGIGGGLALIRGNDSNGVAYCALYAVAIQVNGGSGANVAAVLISNSGSAIGAAFTFSTSGSAITISQVNSYAGYVTFIGL